MAQWVRSLMFAAMAGVAGAGATAAPPAPAPAEPDIVVNGSRDVRGQVRDFVGALTQTPDRQISRFERWSVCPAAVGFPELQTKRLVTRMREVAEAAGIPLGKPGCSPDVILIATPDKRAFIEGLRREHPEYFGDMTPSDIRRAAHQPGPASAWLLEGPPLNSDGKELRLDPATGMYRNDTTHGLSRMQPAARAHYTASVVVVETRAMAGLTTTQLADYAAMRGYAKTDPSRLPDSSVPTILKVLEAPMGTAVPVTLTRWDLGFLRALYASPVDQYAGSQRTNMHQRLEKEIEEPKGQEE